MLNNSRIEHVFHLSHLEICKPEDEVLTSKHVVRDILQKEFELYDKVF